MGSYKGRGGGMKGGEREEGRERERDRTSTVR